MARYQYRCGCGNTVPAERVESRAPGKLGQVRIMPFVLLCEAKDHTGPPEMEREAYTPERREVRD